MKRFFSAILCIALLCGLCNSTVMASSTLAQEQLTLLELTGVLDKDANWDKIITKGEFAGLISRVAFELNEDIKNQSRGNTLTDVNSKNKYYNEIMALYNKGYLPVDNFGRFYPDKNIDIYTASDIALRVLGYSEADRADAGLASKKELLKGVSDNNGEITLYSAYNMIYNVLTCDITDLKNIKYFTNADELTYMTTKLHLYKVTGIVTDDGVNSFYGETETVRGRIKIADGKALINKTGREDLLGLNILGYFSYDRWEDEYYLLAVHERKNDIKIINSANILDFENRTYHYQDGEFGRIKKVYIPRDIIVVYNGKALSLNDNFDYSMYVPENGIVKIYDNNSDGSADIIFIDEYTTYIVERYDNSTNKLYFRDNIEALDLDNKEYVIYDKDGKKLDINEITTGNVVSLNETIDKSFLKILVSTYQQTEKVVVYSGATGDEKAYVNTESGGEYEICDNALLNNKRPALNTTYKFYFDVFDKVVGWEKISATYDWEIGSLVWLRYLDELGIEEYGAKIYSSDGTFYTYKLHKKVRVIDENDTMIVYDSDDAVNAISYTGIIRFKVNSDNRITNIELPHRYGEKPIIEDRLYYMLDTIDHEDKNDYCASVKNNVANLGGAAIVTSRTEVFAVPANKTEYDKYSIKDISAFQNGKYYSVYAYGTDYRTNTAACVCLSGDDVLSTITNDYPETITDVTRTYDEENDIPVYKVKTISAKGEENTYYMEETLYNNGVKCIGAGNTNAMKLEIGDIVYLNCSGKYIKNAVLIYDTDGVVKDEQGNNLTGAIAGTKLSYFSSSNSLSTPFACSNYSAGNAGSANAWKLYGGTIRIFSGWVLSYEDGYMLITNQNPAYGYDYTKTKADGFITEAQIFTQNLAVTVNVGAKGKSDIAKATATDIKPYDIYGADCSRIVITQRAYDQRSINIINKK